MSYTDLARKLRKEQTKAEARFWREVRNRHFYGLKFKRQVPIGQYIVDFCCEEEKLNIELDGGHHAEDEAREYDAKRSAFLEDQGYRVLRYWNDEVFDNMDGIYIDLMRHIGDT